MEYDKVLYECIKDTVNGGDSSTGRLFTAGKRYSGLVYHTETDTLYSMTDNNGKDWKMLFNSKFYEHFEESDLDFAVL